MQWFRLHNKLLNDPVVQGLTDKQFKLYINLLCYVSVLDKSGYIGTLHETAFALRETIDDVSSCFTAFQAHGLIVSHVTDDETFLIPQWQKLQYKSDTSTGRVKKHREKVKRSKTVTVTAPETDTDTEQKQIQKNTQGDVCETTGNVSETLHETVTPVTYPPPSNTHKIKLTEDWRPNQIQWEANCFKAGQVDTNFEPFLFAFVSHFAGQASESETYWQSKLISWMKRNDKPGERKSTMDLLTDRTWADGLVENQELSDFHKWAEAGEEPKETNDFDGPEIKAIGSD